MGGEVLSWYSTTPNLSTGIGGGLVLIVIFHTRHRAFACCAPRYSARLHHAGAGGSGDLLD